MTNDFAVEQPRARKSSALPLIGAVGGGVAGGLLLPKYVGKPKSHEDIVKEMEDRDAFTKNTAEGAPQAAEWKDVQAKAEEVKKAEKAVEDAALPKLAENSEEAKTLRKAEKDIDDYVKKLQENENRKVSGRPTKVTTGTTSKIVPYSSDWRMTPAEAAEYKAWYADYENALKNFEGRKDLADLKAEIELRQEGLTYVMGDVKADELSMIDKKGGTRRAPRPKNASEYLSDYAEDAFAKSLKDRGLVDLSNNEIIRIAGGESALSPNMVSAPRKGRVIKVIKKDGTEAFAVLDKTMNAEYEKQLAQKVENEAKKLTSNYSRFNEIADIMVNNEKLEKTIKFDKGLIKNARTTRENVITDVERWLPDAANYSADMKVIERAKLTNFVPSGSIKVSDPAIESIMKKYSASSPKEAYEILSARVGMVNKYKSVVEGLEKEAENMFKDCDKELAELTKRLEGARSKDNALVTAENKIKGKYKEFLKVEKTTTTSVSKEAGEVAKTFTRDDATKELKEALKKAEDAYKAAAGKSGVVDEAAKKTAQEALEAKKAEFKKTTEDLANKIGKKGMNKWLAVGIGVLAGAGLLWLVAPKKSKEA